MRMMTTPNEREFEIGMDEAWKANLKEMYDDFHNAAMARITRSQDAYDALVAQRMEHLAEIHAQKIRHADFALNKQWNLNETDLIAANAVTSGSAINAAISRHVQDSHGS